jgi:hypothetical protein
MTDAIGSGNATSPSLSGFHSACMNRSGHVTGGAASEMAGEKLTMTTISADNATTFLRVFIR